MSRIQIRGLGWRKDHLDNNDRHLTISVRVPLPSSFDQRTAQSTAAFMPPVYDQKDEGSCTANSGSAGMDYERKRQGLPFLTPSRNFIYYNTRLQEGTEDMDAGGEIRDVIKTLASQGACPESQWPYEDSNLTTKPTDDCYATAAKFEALQYSRVTQAEYFLKHSISILQRPVLYGMSVFNQIQSDRAAKTGMVTLPGSGESAIGGHAIALVGFSDATRLFLFRNSWGAGWGDGGYGFVPYEYILNPDLASDFWVILAEE
jgi:C1A family cysteine protease